MFGSQSGNSEGLAEAWEQEAPRYGLKAKVHDMDGFDIKSMAKMSRVMIVCSTWVEGEMPDNAEELYEEAKSAGKILSITNSKMKMMELLCGHVSIVVCVLQSVRRILNTLTMY